MQWICTDGNSPRTKNCWREARSNGFNETLYRKEARISSKVMRTQIYKISALD
jgi:hypothetical protein